MLPFDAMDTQFWRDEQRKLRDAVRTRRSTNGNDSVSDPHPALRPLSLHPPNLLATPIVSRTGVAGRAIFVVKRLLRRLLAPFVLEPQTQFNQAVVAALAEQREVLGTLAAFVDSRDSAAPELAGGRQIDYLAFEERFRGTSETIESRQAEYLDYFFDRGEVLDIGCGRGEFLALLNERRIPARGVDLDEDMIARCREQGLVADCADAIDFLEAQPDGHFGGVFASQVVEHLSTDYLVALLDAIARKTTSQAVLILETLNPESLPVLTRWFWLDPTHVRLVHPETLQYFIEQAGFAVKSVQFRREIPDEERVPSLVLPGVPATELAGYNEAVERLNDRLFGSLDYFVVGQSGA
jgi:SAM-dependent methyltransferase